ETRESSRRFAPARGFPFDHPECLLVAAAGAATAGDVAAARTAAAGDAAAGRATAAGAAHAARAVAAREGVEAVGAAAAEVKRRRRRRSRVLFLDRVARLVEADHHR